ncbi:UDP-N-acetylmuramoyl-tripeptide--D-alanyl-D-alanine ligase [Nocardioides sp. YIM 152315]|uniref:UDP-N-acetylmuramoyl-tripeptide--D-alanyl-D- alanine ligase n=1 Tax=Nocardioides sp. YIM 152315 TaxID=3031760 RepID=UPI0023DA3BF2|nr:UDP-N-acetylmuramoyl-tripeptide--D-alanyl-D-alanine ligase [Nocardioides sp. YIM 152315]MDF1603069.1 UDP-N-acetylmuramoyl-tripeptide--D-alanyl-D-alanine ligase [Nocardioides sp. YIM 152315]
MLALTLAEIAAVVGGSVHGDPTLVVTGPAYVDSRRPEAAGLFVAVVGERVDGHEYAAGAHAVLGSRPTEAPTVVVADPVVALGRLAGHVVRRLPATVLALTGSQGKTGTKDYLAQVLAMAGPTVATAGSFNNELGLPLTVLGADADTRHLVLEMGARGIGHIAYLCEIAPPHIAAVINVGTAHVGEFGSREAIALAKGEIVEALPEDGVAVLNADDELVAAMADRTHARLLRFGSDAEVTTRSVEVDDLSRPTFEIGHDGAWHPVRLRQSGLHQVQNALAAATMAIAAGVPVDRVAAALSEAEPASPMRMELHERGDGLLVINDAYNANPASMTAALGALRTIGERRGRRTVAVLGEMRELGDSSTAGHHEVGETARTLGIDAVVVVGAAAAAIAEGYGDEAIVTAGRDEALAWVRENVAGADVVLVKASRGAALETIADGLLEGGETTR